MHEVRTARSIATQVRAVGAESPVTAITIRIGRESHLDPEILTWQLGVLLTGSAAETAEIRMRPAAATDDPEDVVLESIEVEI